jgi:hypothetical protein
MHVATLYAVVVVSVECMSAAFAAFCASVQNELAVLILSVVINPLRLLDMSRRLENPLG